MRKGIYKGSFRLPTMAPWKNDVDAACLSSKCCAGKWCPHDDCCHLPHRQGEVSMGTGMVPAFVSTCHASCSSVQQATVLSWTHLCRSGLHRVSHAWEVRLSHRRRSPPCGFLGWGAALCRDQVTSPQQRRNGSGLHLKSALNHINYHSPHPWVIFCSCLKAPHPDVIHSPVLPMRWLGRAFGPPITVLIHLQLPACLGARGSLSAEELTTSCLFGNAFKLFQKLLFVDKSGQSQRSASAKQCKRRNELQRSTASCHWI